MIYNSDMKNKYQHIFEKIIYRILYYTYKKITFNKKYITLSTYHKYIYLYKR